MTAHGCCAVLNEQAHPLEVPLSAHMSAGSGLSAQTLPEHWSSEPCETENTHSIKQLQRQMLL